MLRPNLPNDIPLLAQHLERHGGVFIPHLVVAEDPVDSRHVFELFGFEVEEFLRGKHVEDLAGEAEGLVEFAGLVRGCCFVAEAVDLGAAGVRGGQDGGGGGA